MATFRVNKTDNYTVMSNYHLRDRNLSLKAKGLLSWMLSLPEDWDYSITGIVSCHKEGEDAIKSALSELKNNGYLIVLKLKPESYIDSDGNKIIVRKQIEYEYNIYEQPTTIQDIENQDTGFQSLDFQDVGFQAVGFQDTENQTQINTNITNTKKENIEKENTYKKAQAKPAFAGRSSKRNFSQDSLKDSLASGKEIDSQQKRKKEKPIISQLCLDEIERESYGFDSKTKQLLVQYITFITDSTTKDARRVKTLGMWRKKLSDLLDLSNRDNMLMQKIIKQSLDNKWYKFVDYEEVNKKAYSQNKATNDHLIHQQHSGEEVIARRIAAGMPVY